MTTDLYQIVKELAEAEWPHESLADFEGDPPGSFGTQSMEVPFALLRLSRGIHWIPEPDIEKACHRVAKAVEELDPDAEIVCWWYDKEKGMWYWNNPQGENIPAGSYEEAVFLAGKALLDEMSKEVES